MRELFQAEAPKAPRRTRGAMYKNVTPDYYGYRDEDDGTLLAKESAAEKRAVEAEMEAYHHLKRQRKTEFADGEGRPSSSEDEGGEEDEEEVGVGAKLSSSAVSSAALKAHVPVPSQAVIKDAILSHRKAQLERIFLAPGSAGV